MFNNQSNAGFNPSTNGNIININTHLGTFYSDTCMVSLGFWNDKISLKFHPFTGVNGNGLRQYSSDKNMIVNTSLTLENVTTLLSSINETINPAIKDKKSASVSVTMGMDLTKKIMTVATDGDNITLSISINVDSENKSPDNNTLTHTFAKKEYIENYDPKTGKGDTKTSNADFDNFIIKLNEIYKINSTNTHSQNYSNAIKSAYNANKQASNNAAYPQSTYSAPTINHDGDIGDMLPI